MRSCSNVQNGSHFCCGIDTVAVQGCGFPLNMRTRLLEATTLLHVYSIASLPMRGNSGVQPYSPTGSYPNVNTECIGLRASGSDDLVRTRKKTTVPCSRPVPCGSKISRYQGIFRTFWRSNPELALCERVYLFTTFPLRPSLSFAEISDRDNGILTLLDRPRRLDSQQASPFEDVSASKMAQKQPCG